MLHWIYEFFRQRGLTEPDVVDEVMTSVLPRYEDPQEEPSDYGSDLERIVVLPHQRRRRQPAWYG